LAQDRNKPRKSADDLIDWFTVSYRSIYITVGILLALGGGIGYWWWKSHQPPPPGITDAIPAPAAPTANFAFLDGSVQVKKAGRLEWVPASKDMRLDQGDLVRTGSGAGAEIRFTSGATFHLQSDALFAIEQAGEDPSSKRQRVVANLESGGVNFDTGGGAATIQTPVSRTTAGQNAAGDVAVSQSGESVTRLFRGSATTETAAGQRIDLGANESVTVDPAGKSAGKVALPGVPILLAPPHQAEISYDNPAVSTTLMAWRGAPSAATYHVMVDYTTSFARPLVDQKGWRPTSMELRGLEVGKYYWKVAAVDGSGLEGSFSDFSLFSVTRRGPGAAADATPPSLTLEALEPSSNILHVKGRTEPGASLTVNGQRVDVQSDGTFNEFITLDKPGKQIVVIRATSISGGVNEQKRPVVVTY
jgi:prepilin-type processing-associated H-X9-DG protein